VAVGSKIHIKKNAAVKKRAAHLGGRDLLLRYEAEKAVHKLFYFDALYLNSIALVEAAGDTCHDLRAGEIET
jgi:hypothetical protein